ncbi:hypothetical protein HY086_01530 [Candidatus Gottesmanbacteria bacterium]|nr:hypothetical protein [Candidatus Gottesmanbacteria bacterium]
MDYTDVKHRLEAAQKLLVADAITRDTFESVRTLIRGIHPRIDHHLTTCSTALAKVEKIKEGEVIELTVEAIPEDTEEKKKRKKALLLFIRSWKDLKGEVARIQKEFDHQQEAKHTASEEVAGIGRILGAAKGPFGLITAVAVVVVLGMLLVKGNKPTPQPAPTATPTVMQKKIQVITFGGKQIALSEVYIGTGSDCDSPHYHAKDHTSVKAIDGSTVADPGGCGFGRVKDVSVNEISVSQ